jgi:transcription elongation factor GreA
MFAGRCDYRPGRYLQVDLTSTDGGVVRVGSVVTIRSQGETEQDITIVDSATGTGLWQLTTRTPLGRALFGRRAGDVVGVTTDAGTVKFTIVRVRI